MTLNAKERFNESTYAKTFAEMVNNPAFKFALECAFLEWINTIKVIGTNGLDPVSQAYKSLGIQEYIHVLINLTEPEEVPQAPIRQNLKPV